MVICSVTTYRSSEMALGESLNDVSLISEKNNLKQIFYPFHLGTLPEKFIEKTRLELNETEEAREEGVAKLRALLSENNIPIDTTESDLLRFLRAKKFDVEKSFHLCQNYQFYKEKEIQYFTDLDLESFKKLLRENYFGILPYRDEDGAAIIFYRSGIWSPAISSYTDAIRSALAMIYHVTNEPATQISGIIVLLDSKVLSLDKLMYLIRALKVLLPVAKNCFPLRIKQLHIVNQSAIFNIMWKIVKRMIPEKLLNRVMMHGSDFESLHRYLPPSILPSEYGGVLEPMNNDQLIEKAESILEYFSRLSK